MRSDLEVAVVGAGPYGLAAATHLHAAGVSVRAFGEPMGFWRHQVPAGLYLRSPWRGSHVADPGHRLSLDRFAQEAGFAPVHPIPLDQYIRYSEWFIERATVNIDRRRVIHIGQNAQSFDVTLDGGERLRANRVIVATGLNDHAYVPPEFDTLPAALASHSSKHRSFECFAGRRVIVLGAGQFALESAVLLQEAGAEVEVIARSPHVYWLGRNQSIVRHEDAVGGQMHRPLPARLRAVRSWFIAPAEIAPVPIGWLAEAPGIVRYLSPALQQRIWKSAVQPAGSAWLLPRAQRLRITPGQRVAAAAESDGQVLVSFDNGSSRTVDHVLLATGYRISVTNVSFLDRPLAEAVQVWNGYPMLSRAFESSIAGLHFLGAPAFGTFGPLFASIGGNGYSARALVRHLAGHTHGPGSRARIR